VPRALHRHSHRAARRTVRTARRRGARHVTSTTPALVFFAVASLFPLVMRAPYFLDSLILILMWGAAAAAWNVAGGYAGQISLGHSTFFGLGAYGAAVLGTRWGLSPGIGLGGGGGAPCLGTRWGLSPWIGLVVGALVATVVGLVIGYLSNRLRGPYFVLATIAVSQGLLLGASRWGGVTAGSGG